MTLSPHTHTHAHAHKLALSLSKSLTVALFSDQTRPLHARFVRCVTDMDV